MLSRRHKRTQSNMNDARTDAITAKEANERAPDEKVDSVQAAPPQSRVRTICRRLASAAEAKATASDQGTSLVIATAAELNPTNPTKPTANDAVIDATSMVEDSEVMAATVPDAIPSVMATNDDGVTVSQGEVSQPSSVDQMLLALKRKIAKAEENKSSDATAEVSVKPAMVSLSALSAMSPSPGPKADEYQPAIQYTPSPCPTPDKNPATTQSTPSPDPKKKQSPLSAGADESLMHSGRNFDALVGMDSLPKAAFHRTLLRHPNYTQAYLDHAYNIVHDFRKCNIRVLHVIYPKEGGAVQDDEDKKDGKPDPAEKPVEIGSPDSIKMDSPSNEMVTGFPPSPDEMVYVEDDCMKYVHASGPVDIGCNFAAIDELILSNLTRSSLQYAEYFDLIHDFSIFFDKWPTVDTVQFYQCWISRSIGSHPKNIFLLPLDYYQADVEDIFEDYWNGIEPSVKKNFGMRMWRYVHPASHLRRKINIGKKKSGVSYPPTDLSPAAPWDFNIFKCKIICFTAKNILHYGLFAALNAGNLIHGDKTNKQECSLASFDSSGSRQSPLPRTAAFLEYTYFLLNMCHAIHSWVVEQDEDNTDSDAAPGFESMFDVSRAETKS
jgi:hypothetical protein